MTEQKVSAGAKRLDGVCRGCGQHIVAGETARRSLDGDLYCQTCYRQMRAEVPRMPAAAAIRFRCATCGEPWAPADLEETNGHAICRLCRGGQSSATSGSVKAPLQDTEATQVAADLEHTPLPNLLARMTCPHCWHEFPPDELLWVSRHAELLGDPVLGPEAALRFRPSRFTLAGDALDLRGGACRVLACPRCHLVVPRALAESPPLFFSIAGAPGSGKSHFLAAMTWELRRALPRWFGVTLNDADTVSNAALNGFEETLFLQSDDAKLVSLRKTELQGEMYDQVRVGSQAIHLPRPFIFTLRTSRRRGGDAATNSSGVRVLCLYDNAGEHFQPGMDTPSAPGTQHLARSRAILFLFDPTQHPRFREMCRRVSVDPQLEGAGRTERQDIVLTEVANRVRLYTDLSSGRRHDRPLIVVVSKADIWAGLIGLDLTREPLLASGPMLPPASKSAGTPDAPQVALDVGRIEQISAALRKLLCAITPEFVSAAEDFCQRVVYIPASALGHGPQRDEKTGLLGIRARDVQPRWVTAPILYACAAWGDGMIPAAPRPGATDGAAR